MARPGARLRIRSRTPILIVVGGWKRKVVLPYGKRRRPARSTPYLIRPLPAGRTVVRTVVFLGD